VATMFYPVADNAVWHDSITDEMLGALSARPAAALFVVPKVHLRINAHTINPRADSPATVDEATFTGYVDAAPTIVGPVNLTDQGRGVQATVTFLCTADLGAGEEITGWYLTDEVAAAPTRIYAEGDFPTPLTILLDGDGITLTMVLPIRALQDR
jgi:hypothetical protein